MERSNFSVRIGQPTDALGTMALIQELAEYEKEGDQVEITADQLAYDLFHGDFAKGRGLLVAEEAGNIIGIAIYYTKYSTWKGDCIHLEDLVVSEKHRRKGVGKVLFNRLAKIAKEQGVKRLEWQVLDWNEPAIKFYRKINSQLDSEWINCKLTAEQLQSF